MKKKLSFRQRKAAQLLHAGCTVTKVAKYLKVDYTTVIKWRNNSKKFKKYLHHLEKEFVSYVDRKQKYLVDETLKQLQKMLHSKNHFVRMKAIECSLKLNARFPTQEESIRMKHEGSIVNTHEGAIDINPEKLSNQKKEKLKEMLADIREMSGVN